MEMTYHILIIGSRKLSQYAEFNCNLLKNFRDYTLVLCSQSLLHRLFQRKSFVITNQSVKTTKFSKIPICEQFAIYGKYILSNKTLAH